MKTSPLPFPTIALRFVVAMMLGTAGGYVFVLLRLPLPWMLGSMIACTMGALLGLPITVPRRIRPPMTAIIGVMLGAQFSPAVFSHIGGWLPTLACLALFILTCAVLCTFYFRIVGGFDVPTAFFAGMPGGFVEMITLAEHHGGQIQPIALVHSARILLLVLTLPFVVQWLGHVHLGPRTQSGVSLFDTRFAVHMWFAATAIVGFTLGRMLRLPAGAMMGPFILSAAVHALGISDFKPSYQFVYGAQLVLGAFLGCSFAGADRRAALNMLVLSIGSTLILATCTVGFAFLASFISGYEPIPLILAYSPGGLTEMSLISLALQIEVAFVTCHHFVRIILVIVGAGFLFRLFQKDAPADVAGSS